MGIYQITTTLRCVRCSKTECHLLEGNTAMSREAIVLQAARTCAACNRIMEPVTHTFTDTELARLIAVACREQRYALVDQFQENSVFGSMLTPGYAGIIQNAPAPTFEHVLQKYEELKES